MYYIFLEKSSTSFNFSTMLFQGNSSYIITEHYSEDSNVASIKQNI